MQEPADKLEYMTAEKPTTLAKKRAASSRLASCTSKYLSLHNEKLRLVAARNFNIFMGNADWVRTNQATLERLWNARTITVPTMRRGTRASAASASENQPGSFVNCALLR